MSRIQLVLGLALIIHHVVASAWAQSAPAAHPPASAAAGVYRSAFEAYQPFGDQPVAPWMQTNDTVREVGGWRAYAREAQGAQTPAPAASSPASSASSPHAGHH